MTNTINTEKAPAAIGPYSQAKEISGMLFCSGQIGINPATGDLAEGGIEAQTEQACKNVGEILRKAGFDYNDVIKTVCFLSDIGNFKAFNEIYAKYFISKPARSCVAVREIPKSALCEIEVIAAK